MIVIWLFLFLFLKHFVVDFLLQVPYMYRNKGNWSHPGGYCHAGLHGVVSLTIFLFYVSSPLALALSIAEFVAHYLIDWAKVNVNAYMHWGPTTSEQFWWLLGLDQLLHSLTYLVMISVVVQLS